MWSAQHGAFFLKSQKSASKALEKLSPRDCEAKHTLHGNLSVVTKKMDRQFLIQTEERWGHLRRDEK